MPRAVALFALAVAITPLAAPAAAAELGGRVEVRQRSRSLAGEAERAVVYFSPSHKAPVTPPATAFEVVTEGKEFAPRLLAVPLGSRVRFPNRDPILHNVFSVSGGNAFDLGLYDRGPGRDVTFDEPGLVRVFCNVHHSMVAYVLVLDTPYFTRPDGHGAFRLAGLPDAPGTLTVWHERSDPWSRQLERPHGAPLEITLEASRPRVPKHMNKLGKPYRKERGRDYR
ncbi:MAG TPA: methylamine utilization protein [Thermoanaerobaculia bacterium]|nr:methylamine utilization protein [Thermoanaerobaculia bacterium]